MLQLLVLVALGSLDVDGKVHAVGILHTLSLVFWEIGEAFYCIGLLNFLKLHIYLFWEKYFFGEFSLQMPGIGTESDISSFVENLFLGGNSFLFFDTVFCVTGGACGPKNSKEMKGGVFIQRCFTTHI